MVKNVKVDVAHKVHEIHESRWHVAHRIRVYIILSDINKPRHFGMNNFGDIQDFFII
jgi:hypothetical protein